MDLAGLRACPGRAAKPFRSARTSGATATVAVGRNPGSVGLRRCTSRRPASGASVKRGKQKFVGYQCHRSRHRHPRLPAGGAAGGAGAAGEPVLRGVGRAGERHRRGARAGTGRCRWTRCARTPRAPSLGGSFAEEFEPAPLHAAVDAPAAARHRAQPQRHPSGALRASQAARHPCAAAGLAGAAGPAAVRLLAPWPDRRRPRSRRSSTR